MDSDMHIFSLATSGVDKNSYLIISVYTSSEGRLIRLRDICM